MKRLLFIFIVSFFPALAGAVQLPDNMFFRAMNDEMQRSLKELRLKDHPNPYYIAYWLFHSRNLTIGANMGTLRPQVDNPQPKGDLRIVAFVSVGSDKQDGLGFAGEEYPYWREIELPAAWGALGYESIRQYLWKLTDRAYLNAVNLYKKKQSYKQKKNIVDTLPDVIPAAPARFQEDIAPFEQPQMQRLKDEVRAISALGKTKPFVESFEAALSVQPVHTYFLNSRQAFAQYATTQVSLELKAAFRQPDGKTAEASSVLWLKDTSAPEMERAKTFAQDFLQKIHQAHGATSGEAYVGPVLLKPRAAARLMRRAVLNDMQRSKPFLLAYSEDDAQAGKLYKKQKVRVSTDLLTVYDRPLQRTFEGIALARFAPVDSEGVAAEDLTLIQNGRVKDFPLTQRPLTKNHRSNGHAYMDNLYGPRERLTNVLVEPKEQWTDAQMEEKLRQRCRELGLAYGYILHQADPSGDLGIERLYTADGRKETVLNLKWDGNFFTQRDLRNVLAVGGEKQLADNDRSSGVTIAPSILLQEVELVPREHKPHRQPFLEKPKIETVSKK